MLYCHFQTISHLFLLVLLIVEILLVEGELCDLKKIISENLIIYFDEDQLHALPAPLFSIMNIRNSSKNSIKKLCTISSLVSI